MEKCLFNFNNEVDTFAIEVYEDGHVVTPGENGPIAEYTSVEQMAEMYAQARDVKPENLKNWTLLKNGNVYSYVLRAGTAGVDVSDVEEQLEQVFADLEGSYHALSIARAKEQIMADGTKDLTEVLVHCTETEIAKAVYDAMQKIFENAGEAEEDLPAEDTRSELEKYIDNMEETPGALRLLAFVAGVPAANKAELLEALQSNSALSNANTLDTIYNNTVNDAISNGIGVDNAADAITVITQVPVGEKDGEVKGRLVTAAKMARRDKVNVSVDIVGQNHIRHTAELVALNDLEGLDVFVRSNVPYVVRFSDTVDAELEAERDAAAAEDTAEESYEDYDADYDEDGEDEEY